MSDWQDTLEGIGYIRQTTPAGREIMVNADRYPLSPETLALEDAYAADWVDIYDEDEEEWYESRDPEQRALDEDLGYDDEEWVEVSIYDDED